MNAKYAAVIRRAIIDVRTGVMPMGDDLRPSLAYLYRRAAGREIVRRAGKVVADLISALHKAE